jgi:hypothetical protein
VQEEGRGMLTRVFLERPMIVEIMDWSKKVEANMGRPSEGVCEFMQDGGSVTLEVGER